MATAEQKRALQEAIDNVDEHKRIVLNDDGTRTMALLKPIDLGKNKELAELVFKEELSVADLEEGDKGEGDTSQAARLVAAASSVSYGNIRKMKTVDFELACLVIGKLSGKDEETGGIS